MFQPQREEGPFKMPKVGRTVDPMVGEALVSPSKQARMSVSTSPLVPALSILTSLQPGQELGTVPDISSKDYPMSSSVGPLAGLADSYFPSVETCLSPHRNPGGEKKNTSPSTGKASIMSSGSEYWWSDCKKKGDTPLQDGDSGDTSDGGFSSMHDSGGDSLLDNADSAKVELEEKEQETVCGNQSHRDGGVTSRKANGKEGQVPADSEQMCDEGKDSAKDRQEESKHQAGGTSDPTTMTGCLNAVAGNGDKVMHGVLPTVLQQQGPPLNTCFPAADGNWYQIFSATMPSVISNQQTAENCSNTPTTTTSSKKITEDITASSTPHPQTSLTLRPSHPLIATAAAATSTTSSKSGLVSTVTNPSAAPDPFLALLQQYSAGTACGPDLQTSLPSLHLPLSLATAAAAIGGAQTPTPRYLCATNPRNGQLLILSTVGDVGAGQVLQQQLQLSQHFALPQVKPQDQAGWKSPLGLSQRDNCLLSVSGGVTRPGSRPATDVSKQLLHSKQPAISSITQRASNDENLPSMVAAQELLALASPARARTAEQGAAPQPFLHASPSTDGKASHQPIRENHNMKERRRRARIKDACDLMRQLVPGMSEKTDKATVFEFSARYIHFLKGFVGTHHDKDFLIKYSPY